MPRASKIDAAAKAARVVQLRALGIYTFQEIADQVGYKSAQGAHDAYKRAIASEIHDGVETMRANAVKRLDAIIRANIPAAIGANGRDRDPKAAEIVMKADAERRKYFAGLEVPAQAEITHKNVTPDEFASWLQGAQAQYELERERQAQDA